MQEIQFIAPAALHDEMLRLRNDTPQNPSGRASAAF